MTELNATSSIGAQWPPQPSTQNRIRGFATERVLSTPDDADWFAENGIKYPNPMQLFPDWQLAE